jgi:hypothetical protein
LWILKSASIAASYSFQNWCLTGGSVFGKSLLQPQLSFRLRVRMGVPASLGRVWSHQWQHVAHL